MEDESYFKDRTIFSQKNYKLDGFLATEKLQKELGKCRALLNTPNGMRHMGMLLLKL